MKPHPRASHSTIPRPLRFPAAAGLLLLAAAAARAQGDAASSLDLALLPGEGWWGGAVTLGSKMPFGGEPLEVNLRGDNRGNQYAPLLLSSKGRYVWCDKAFAFSFRDGRLKATAAGAALQHRQAGTTRAHL